VAIPESVRIPWDGITILAGSTAKIPFRGIPGIARIPPDSGRNTWRTVKNSDRRSQSGSAAKTSVEYKRDPISTPKE